MSPVACTLLVVAKAPVAGVAKTRLAKIYGPTAAAALAAAALLDTLLAVEATPVSGRVVALTGDLADAQRSEELQALLGHFTVIPQRGATFGDRLAAAHEDAQELVPGPVLQIGMDTPQVSPDALTRAATRLVQPDVDAVFGPATDGGWWALGLATAGHAGFLAGIAMSQPDTGAATLTALRAMLESVELLPMLTDVDTADDVEEVAGGLAVDSHFRRAVEERRITG